ncbi:hypothetical protein ACHWQZ_G010156 [Mnemiopsis leidyi]
MVEVTLSVEGGGVYIVGQTIKCALLVQNNSDVTDRLAWATGQISGHVTVDERHVQIAREQQEEVVTNSSSALTKHVANDCFFSSDPEILFCDLQLPPQSSKELKFSGIVPTHSPPSYRGSYIKYSYIVLVGLQRVNKPVTLINLPIRIINLPGITLVDGPKKPLSHPFAPREECINYEDYFMDKVQSLCCKRPRSFEVKTSEGLVSIVRLTKGAYRLGDPIEVNLEFGDLQCVQVTLKLQALETLSPESEVREGTDTRCTTHDTKTIQCIHTRSTAVTLHIPLNVVNSFSTNIVLVRWQVHFDFVIAHLPQTAEIVDAGLTSVSAKGLDCDWRPLDTLNVSTLSWELPIRVVPTLPQYIATIAWQRTQTKDTV